MWWVAGVDEAGRGPIAGPVVAAAVILDPRSRIEGIKDSKKLSPAKRESIASVIFRDAVAVGVGVVREDTIDRINIRNAALLAMKIAVDRLKVKPSMVFVDGRDTIPNVSYPQRTVVGGDAKIYVVSAASIVAKVVRDKIMCGWHRVYPQYGFSMHKGYPTKIHLDAIRIYGYSPIHRLSFRVKGLDKNEDNT
ncbi:MAG: ribonuclease HII [Synergistetes bacterium]|nr:ribonuclease HII [Synergistota bacterium]